MRTRRLTLLTAGLVILGLVAYIAYDKFLAPSGLTPRASGYAGQPTLGEPGAPVKLILFENFMCEYCKAFEEEVFPQLERDYIDTGKVEAYYVNLAWGSEQATLAGLAGECAYRQNETAFWPLKTALYEAQGRWQTAEDLIALAAGVDGLEPEALRGCLEEGRYADEVQRDLELGDRVGVEGTPSIVIGDQGFEAPSAEVLRQAIDRRLEAN